MRLAAATKIELVAQSVLTEWFVAATGRLVCSDLKHEIDQSQSGKLIAGSHVQSSPPNVAFSFEAYMANTEICNCSFLSGFRVVNNKFGRDS